MRKTRSKKSQEREKTIKSALSKLKRELRQANKELEQDSRAAAISSVGAVLEFVRSLPGSKGDELTSTLFALLGALADLNDGRAVPMLMASTINHRRPDARPRKIVKAFTCYTIEELLNSANLKMEAACRLVAKELELAKVPIGSRNSSAPWKTVKGWRDRMSKLPGDDQQRHLYNVLKEVLTLRSFKSPADAQQALIENLRISLRRINAGVLK